MNKSTRYTSAEKRAEREMDAFLNHINTQRLDIMAALRHESNL